MTNTIKRYWPVFVLPTMLAFAIGFLIPFVSGLYLSFCDFTTVSNATFVGFSNYVKAFTDTSSDFLHGACGRQRENASLAAAKGLALTGILHGENRR